MDELPEFNRMTLESLRQPLEDRTVSVARAKEAVEYPANFILVATANPCQCGYYGTAKPCSCLPSQINRYQQRLSGPIIDRIDLFANVHEVEHSKLLRTDGVQQKPNLAAKRVADARVTQQQRQGSTLNSTLSNAELRQHAKLSSEAKSLLDTAAERLSISARAYMRTIKVSRTIADLDQSDTIKTQHITEALQFRKPEVSALTTV